jgi:hypothetical protein
MKKFLATACLTAAAVFGLAQVSEANGLFRRNRGGCCDTPCASAPCASAPVHHAVEQKFEERKVTRYKAVMVERVVDVVECKRVNRDVKFEYTVCVPVTTQEKRKVAHFETVSKEVDYVYTVMVPKTVQKKVQCTTYQCVRENIVEKVPVCRTVCVNYVDECGRCCVRRERVTTMEEVTRCVVKRVPIVTEQVVNVTVCEPVQHKGKKTVCDVVRSEKEVLVNVCRVEHQKREGVRTVCDIVTEKVKRKVQVCEMQPYEETIRVAIGGHCASSCDDGCGGGRGHGHARRGIFSRGGSCCH